MQDNIDLIESDGYMLLAYVNDRFYSDDVPAHCKHKTLQDLATHKKTFQRKTLDIDPATDAFNFLVSCYARTFGLFILCDVGCHYGVTAMDSVSVAAASGGHPHVFAFDSGQASSLSWRNFENNGFDIQFVQAAVGSFDGHAVMGIDPGNTVNDRLVNTNGQTVPVKCVRLDSYILSHCSPLPACVKVDTQGAEPSVVAGMTELLRSVPVSMKLEFTPWAMARSGVDPATFANDLMETHLLFDLGHNNNRLIEVRSASELVLRADSGPPFWCDVLGVPKDCPDLQGAIISLFRSETRD